MTRMSGLKRGKRDDDSMTDRKEGQTLGKKGTARPKAKSGAREERQARLAAALRENLRRRKKGKLTGKPD